jgi:alginate O-acetyltransferase complex protein AlgI
MIFNSLTFIVFFALVLGLYYLPLSWSAHKIILLCASYVFYGAWNPPFLLVLVFTTFVDWFTARQMGRTTSDRTRNALLLVSLVSNLGLLSFFKYGTFFLDNFTMMVNRLGISYHPAQWRIILPIGISFYTFHSLSYTIDVYRKRLQPTTSLRDFALFVTFFPALVAGPIIRASHFLPQLAARKRATADEFGWGLTLLFVGLFEKLVLADMLLAPVADRVYAATVNAGVVSAWTGTLAFSGQIFFDFAGYSTCALGAALCFGFTLKRNFNYPYAAIGFSDFWKRWHISLSSWLRDYLYIPLGGNGASVPRVYANLMITMLLGGLWHGAAWRFVVWGGLHGTYLAAEKFLREALKRRSTARLVIASVPVAEGGFIVLTGRLFRPVLALTTYALVCVTWVFFRAQDFASARGVIAAMIGRRKELMSIDAGMIISLIVVTLMLCAHWYMRERDLSDIAKRIPGWLRPLILAFIVVSVLYVIVSGDSRAFIYFQF